MLAASIIAATLSSPLAPTTVWGSTYVFAQLGPYGNLDCFGGNTIDLTLDLLLQGTSDSLICIDGSFSTQAIAEARIDLQPTEFTMHINGWGEAVGDSDVHAFSRHDVNATMELDLTENRRIRVDWFMHSVGLAYVQLELQRIGDVGGPNDLSEPIIDRAVSTYIDPIMIDGVDVLFMPQGRWRIRLLSTHQAMYSKPGFMHGFARTNHLATFIPLGDVDGSTAIDVEDILLLLSQFGTCTTTCLGDLDGDGAVNVTDLLQVLADYGQSV